MASKGGKTGSSSHTAGIFADMTLDGPEIGTLVAVIDRAKNLPNRRTMGKQDPYCAMRLGKEAKKTSTDRRGGQTPKWDQEVRFTVHDSADYLKLKCSIFNDDKKTDMIGEAWIDLTTVIVPGGGQNDLWHQLQFRGKYAGEVRMELTYYDTRPKESLGQEKKRDKEKADMSKAQSGSREVSGPRQLGPREVKRRPLPTEPLKQEPAPTPATVAAPVVAPATRAQLPEQSRAVQLDESHVFQPPPPQQQQQWDSLYDSPLQYGDPRVHGNDRAGMEAPYQPTNLPGGQYVNEPLDYTTQLREPHEAVCAHPHIQSQSSHHSLGHLEEATHSASPRFHSARSSLQTTPAHQQYSPPMSSQNHHNGPSPNARERGGSYSSVPAAYGSSPPLVRPDWSSPGSTDPRNQSPMQRWNTSPVRSDVFRDSPLRQSISQQGYDDDDDEAQYGISEDESLPPPPPPIHRDSLPNSSSQPNLHRDMPPVQVPQPLKFGSGKPRISPFDRSPLQNIERNYDPQHQFPIQGVSSPAWKDQRNSPHSEPMYSMNSQPAGRSSYDRPRSGIENTPPSLRSSYGQPSIERDEIWNHGGRHLHRQSFVEGTSPLTQEPEKMRNSYSPYERSDSGAERPRFGSEPPLSKTATPNRDVQTVPSGHSPVPQLLPESDRSDVDSVPFGPDSYAVFNPSSPSSSAVGSEARYETAEQVKEMARQNEVQKLRDQGPIIGNDGRVIDPSDHLPTDTWAPEPERKNRKPEMVIRYKTKENVPRTPHRPDLSTGVARPHSISGPSHSTSYSPSEPTVRPGHQVDGRNRLQKNILTRPSHMQPHYQTHSSPIVPTTSQIGSSPSPDYPVPPEASDYRRFNPPDFRNGDFRGGQYSQYNGSSMPPLIPAKFPIHAQSLGRDDRYAAAGYPVGMDALSAELSTIDIGAGPGARGVRTRRGYGY